MSTLVKTNGCNVPVAAWNPFRDLERISRAFGAQAGDPEWNLGAWTPAIDVHEDENQYTLTADLPGLKKEDISLTVMDNVITLKGERKQEAEKKEKGYHRIERSYGSFQRAFQIPGGVEGSKVDARFENGVLTVTLPKPESACTLAPSCLDSPSRIDCSSAALSGLAETISTWRAPR